MVRWLVSVAAALALPAVAAAQALPPGQLSFQRVPAPAAPSTDIGAISPVYAPGYQPSLGNVYGMGSGYGAPVYAPGFRPSLGPVYGVGPGYGAPVYAPGYRPSLGSTYGMGAGPAAAF